MTTMYSHKIITKKVTEPTIPFFNGLEKRLGIKYNKIVMAVIVNIIINNK